MKRKLLLLLMGTLILTFISNQALAVGTHTIPFHKFAVFENGKLTDDRIVAFITTTEYQGKAYAFWRGITIGTNKGAKKIVLTSDSYDTYDNNISNVNVGKDIFLSPSLQYSLLSGKRI